MGISCFIYFRILSHTPLLPAFAPQMFKSTKQQILFALFALFAVLIQVQGAAADAGDVIAGLLGAGTSFPILFIAF